MKKVGLVGYRGMVGSVLMGRMLDEGDFKKIEATFFSTSMAGKKAPTLGGHEGVLHDAKNIAALEKMDIIITCQGGAYTKEIHPALRRSGWDGYWIDAASALRMKKDTTLILDPVNLSSIKTALTQKKKDFVGPNCTVSLMLMAVGGLFTQGHIEWLTSMTYQAASGAGARHMTELLKQMKSLGGCAENICDDPSKKILDIDQLVSQNLRSSNFPAKLFGAPLAGSLIPWIDVPVDGGQTKEEWKGITETNKILNTKEIIPIDGTCVRVGAMRCHSQALTIKLNKNLPLDEIEAIISESNPWVKLVANNKEDTLKYLSPSHISGELTIAVGRVRKMNLGDQYLNIFTVGDQLLWGAAEPLRRMLLLLLE